MSAELLLAKLQRQGALSTTEVTAFEALDLALLTVERGQQIAEQGARLDDLFIVSSGIVGRCKHLGGTGRQIVALHLPGDLCNFDVSGDRPLDFTLVALSRRATLGVIGGTGFDRLKSVGHLGQTLGALAQTNAAISRAWLANVVGRRSDVRLAHLLCELDARGGYDARKPIALELTQGDLADCIGVSAVQLNRSVTTLRAAGLLAKDRRSILIGDHVALAELAGFDPGYLS